MTATEVTDPAGPTDEADWTDFTGWLDDLPEPARQALAAAAENWADEAVAEAHVLRALAAAPDHFAARVGAYKFYFYRKRLPDAVPLALWCVQWAARRLGLPEDWRQVRPDAARFTELDSLPRLYLFALKAYGYVLVRTGSVTEGRAAVAKVADLDPEDKVGAGRLLPVIDRGGIEDGD